jgi:hypothetical protein
MAAGGGNGEKSEQTGGGGAMDHGSDESGIKGAIGCWVQMQR